MRERERERERELEQERQIWLVQQLQVLRFVTVIFCDSDEEMKPMNAAVGLMNTELGQRGDRYRYSTRERDSVCVCVCEREREIRERGRNGEMKRK